MDIVIVVVSTIIFGFFFQSIGKCPVYDMGDF